LWSFSCRPSNSADDYDNSGIEVYREIDLPDCDRCTTGSGSTSHFGVTTGTAKMLSWVTPSPSPRSDDRHIYEISTEFHFHFKDPASSFQNLHLFTYSQGKFKKAKILKRYLADFMNIVEKEWMTAMKTHSAGGLLDMRHAIDRLALRNYSCGGFSSISTFVSLISANKNIFDIDDTERD
jgi:hypothetical protein